MVLPQLNSPPTYNIWTLVDANQNTPPFVYRIGDNDILLQLKVLNNQSNTFVTLSGMAIFTLYAETTGVVILSKTFTVLSDNQTLQYSFQHTDLTNAVLATGEIGTPGGNFPVTYDHLDCYLVAVLSLVDGSTHTVPTEGGYPMVLYGSGQV